MEAITSNIIGQRLRVLFPDINAYSIQIQDCSAIGQEGFFVVIASDNFPAGKAAQTMKDIQVRDPFFTNRLINLNVWNNTVYQNNKKSDEEIARIPGLSNY
ncbi:hypothetical protein DLAC_01654 [Tieghemostelium lacteum]|uniref:Uncharacterized protein n=1 Tax=Tieghemostelium lacteum TaxID=361077 RepID=A0A152A5Z8_TIELA|nr:hypothetical protein DLAC_01654 [Tieghemostelium lacteum]|eukprot:KYR01652.1 hypothetical protein DLAC_01654 [Tieghemostelium lacteum]